MRKALVIVTILLVASAVHAQRIHGFVSAGATLSQIEGDELKGFRMLGFTGGVGAITSLDRYGDWRISVEALYSQRGAFNNTSDPFRIALPLSYVDIPLLLHYRDPWGGLLIGLGLCYSRLVEQPHSTLRYDKNYFFPDTTDMEFLNNDLMMVADIRFPIWRGLWFDIRWQYSIIAIKRDWEFTEYRGYDNEGNPKAVKWKNDCYNNSLAFRLIWQF
ncbi:MAG: hypothetical protein ACSW8I_07345 [bacterium]